MKTKKDRFFIVLFLLPMAALYLLYLIIPIGMTVVTGFTDWNGMTAPVFNGIKNYIDLSADPLFKKALGNTVAWVFMILFLQLPLAAITAIILNKQFKGWKIYRGILYFPVLISLITSGIMWRMGVYNYDAGALNRIVRLFGGQGIDYLGNMDVALICVVLTHILYPGYYTIIILAKLATIDSSLYEAAKVDGASSWQQDLYITIPYMKSVLAVCVVLATSASLKNFDTIYSMTQGGPSGATMNLAYYMYENINVVFKGGLANAVGTILMVVGVTVALIVNKISAKLEVE